MNRQRTFSVLLAVAIVLLGLDLALRLSPRQAVAQEPPWEGEPPPVQAVSIVVDTAPFNAKQQIYRLWSDGTVEWNRVDIGKLCLIASETTWCGWVTVPETTAP